jgi:hypothetical protein
VIGCKRGWIRKSMVVMVVQNIHDKKNDVILYVKVWIIIIYEYIILNAFQILQQNKTKRNRKKKKKKQQQQQKD